MKKLILLGLALAAFSAALAMPTILGMSGGFLVQDADIQKGITLTATSDDDWDYNIPLTQLLVGVTPNLELGAGGFKWTSTDMEWYVAGKYLLPWTVAKGKLAIGAQYFSGDGDAEWAGTVSCSWPVFLSSTFTAEALFHHFDDERGDRTIFMAALSKAYKNGSILGCEVYNPWSRLMDGYTMQGPGDSIGTVYYQVPINEQLTGRVAFNGIGTDGGIKAFWSVNGKF